MLLRIQDQDRNYQVILKKFNQLNTSEVYYIINCTCSYTDCKDCLAHLTEIQVTSCSAMYI